MLDFDKYKKYDGDNIRIAVLDTGVSLENTYEQGIGIFVSEDGVVHRTSNIEDDIGHGTAVISILHRYLPNAIIIPIKVIFDGILAHEDVLISALDYIDQHIDCDIIHISIGLQCCDNIEALYSQCKRLYVKGVIIVAAFDNGGLISYPAAFDCVIGIDSERMVKRYEYAKTNEDIVNYVADSREVRVKWIGNTTQMVSGNSFTAPVFSAYIAKVMQSGIKGFDEIKELLDDQAAATIKYGNINTMKFDLVIQKAIVFPFNKEMHSLARYRDVLDFKIVGFYDSKYTGNVSKNICDLLRLESYQEDLLIQDVAKIDWTADFDTVILGHATMLSEACGHDYIPEFIGLCEKHKKQLYSLSDVRNNPIIRQRKISYYVPYIDEPDGVSMLRKTYCIGKPVLGIVGTASRQGKFSLQIKLRSELFKMGYKVGFLGTEPTAPLFGADAVYPIGYEGTVKTKGLMSVYTINQILGFIEKKQPDIILFGSQSQTIPNDSGGLKQYPVAQNELILACQADAYILCVSCEDSIEYVEHTIAYLESIYPSKVICIALSPLKKSLRWSVLSHKKNIVSEQEEEAAINQFQRLGLPIYIWRKEEQFSKMVQRCIDYFSEI